MKKLKVDIMDKTYTQKLKGDIIAKSIWPKNISEDSKVKNIWLDRTASSLSFPLRKSESSNKCLVK